MTRPTHRSATNPTSRRKHRPPSRWGTAPTLPCLQWRPRSVDRGSPPQVWRSGRGVKGAAHGCYITTGGGLHTEWAHFHFFGGWGDGGLGRMGKGVGHEPWYMFSQQRHCSSHWALLWLSILLYSTCWAWPSLPAVLQHKLPHSIPHFRPGWPKRWRDTEWAQPGQAFFSVILLRERGSIGVAAVRGCMTFGANCTK